MFRNRYSSDISICSLIIGLGLSVSFDSAAADTRGGAAVAARAGSGRAGNVRPGTIHRHTQSAADYFTGTEFKGVVHHEVKETFSGGRKPVRTGAEVRTYTADTAGGQHLVSVRKTQWSVALKDPKRPLSSALKPELEGREVQVAQLTDRGFPNGNFDHYRLITTGTNKGKYVKLDLGDFPPNSTRETSVIVDAANVIPRTQLYRGQSRFQADHRPPWKPGDRAESFEQPALPIFKRRTDSLVNQGNGTLIRHDRDEERNVDGQLEPVQEVKTVLKGVFDPKTEKLAREIVNGEPVGRARPVGPPRITDFENGKPVKSVR